LGGNAGIPLVPIWDEGIFNFTRRENMLDIHLFRNNPGKVKEIFAKRGCSVDVDRFLEIDRKYNQKKAMLDEIRNRLKEQDGKMKDAQSSGG
jgi:seryl-tRNA synthetase